MAPGGVLQPSEISLAVIYRTYASDAYPRSSPPLLRGPTAAAEDEEAAGEEEAKIDETLTCPFCHHLCERPVSADCGHNYCLKVREGQAI